jgi:hypothetical protein
VPLVSQAQIAFFQEFSKLILILIFSKIYKTTPQQLSISTLNLFALGKIDPITRKYARAYQSASLKVKGHEKNKRVKIRILIQMYKRESIIKVVRVSIGPIGDEKTRGRIRVKTRFPM